MLRTKTGQGVAFAGGQFRGLLLVCPYGSRSVWGKRPERGHVLSACPGDPARLIRGVGAKYKKGVSFPPRGTHGGVHVKLIRRTVPTQPLAQAKVDAPSIYLFCHKSTGTAHFQVNAGPDGELPLDHAAGLLAMHCMVRGQSPSDYLIMVPASSENLQDLTARAQKLLEAGHSVKTSVKLTRREEEVLDGVLRSLANKEIASELNLSERTVKFHVSSLLSKFKVRSRMELMREASSQVMKPLSAAGSPAAPVSPFAREEELDENILNSGKVLPLARPRTMMA